jgi:hypothetical protein
MSKNEELIIGTVAQVKRLTNSVNGNGRWAITLRAGRTRLETKADCGAMMVNNLDNARFVGNTFGFLMRRNRVVDILTPEGEEITGEMFRSL